MAAFTTTTTGNWSAGATWVGGVAPNLAGGDTATISHAVTVDVNAVIDGLTISAALTVANGVTFTVAGAVTQGNANFILGTTAGAHLIADTTAGSFAWTQGTANSQSNCKFISNGTSGSHATVTVTGGNRFYIAPDTAFFHTGAFDCDYTDFSGVRNAAGTIGFQLASFGLNSLGFFNCTFDDCAEIDSFYDFDAVNGGTFRIEDCIWSNTPSGSQCLDIRANTTGGTAPTIERCGFDRIVATTKAIGVVWRDNMFDLGASFSGAMTNGVWERNFVRNVDNDLFPSGGVAWKDCYLLSDDATGNPHWLSPTSNLTYDGLIFDYPHSLTFDTGDGLLNTDATGITIQNCLMLPGPDGWTGGFLCNLGSSNSTPRGCKALHNTVCGEQAMAVYLKDPGFIQNGQVWSEIKSNLCYSPAGGTESAAVLDLSISTSSPVTPWDLAAGSGCTHNGFHNGIAYIDPDNGNANYTGYLHRFPTSGTPGSNDVVADPQFVDYGRNLIEWAVHKGVAVGGDTNATKVTNARALLRSNPSLIFSDLIPWVRAGYAPTNENYRGAGHDGADIGAVAMEALFAVPPPSIVHSFARTRAASY